MQLSTFHFVDISFNKKKRSRTCKKPIKSDRKGLVSYSCLHSGSSGIYFRSKHLSCQIETSSTHKYFSRSNRKLIHLLNTLPWYVVMLMQWASFSDSLVLIIPEDKILNIRHIDNYVHMESFLFWIVPLTWINIFFSSSIEVLYKLTFTLHSAWQQQFVKIEPEYVP